MHKKRVLSFLMIFLFLFGFRVEAFVDNGCSGDIIKRVDSLGTTPLPKRFRIDSDLDISGSSQFTRDEIVNIKNAIGDKPIIDVDLRLESHGLLNNIAFNYHKVNGFINEGLTSAEVVNAERGLLSKIKIGDEVTLCKTANMPVLTLVASYVSTEVDAVTKEGMTYKRLGVRDGNVPKPDVVDSFVELVKNQPKGSHIHFHCEEGEGRTTSFMVMYSMMKNYDKKSLAEIVLGQINLGGIEIRDLPKRAEFIMHFYEYCKENGPNGFETTYSSYIRENNLAF